MSRIIDEMHETARGLHASGVIDKRRMLEYEALYRANHVPQFTGDQVKALRGRLNMSQSALAIIINTSVNTIRAWELNAKKPGGASCLLLDILNRKGIEALL